MRVACILFPSPFKRKEDLEKIAEASLRFSSQIALGEKCIFIEIEKSKTLYTEQGFTLRMQSLLKRFGLQARIAIGNDLASALAMATYGKTAPERLPIESIQIYSNPFQHSESLEKVVYLLKRLGVTTLKELCNLPRSTLASRFGKEPLLALHYIEASFALPWPAWKAPEKLLETVDVDDSYSIKELEPILFLLKNALDKMVLRLKGRSELVSRIEVRVIQEKYSYVSESMRSWTLELAYPQGSTLSLLSIIKERMDANLRRTPLEAPIKRVEVEILKTVYGNAKQKDFFSKKEEEQEALKSLVTRLTDKLGYARVFHALAEESYLPEKSWKKVLDEPRANFSENLPERPLRVLKTPQALKRIDHYFLHKTKKWKMVEMSGPERLSGEWWVKGKERDYFRVKTEQGEELWIYQSPDNQEYFLHGIYD